MKSKSLFWISVAIYTLLLAACIFYFKERVVFFDAAYQFCHVLIKNDLAIQVNRFGAAFTQLFPLIGSRMHLSLPALMKLYSLSFVIFYFAAFLFTWKVLKSPQIALVILLFTILITAHSFFWIQCELVQGVVFTLVFLAFVEKQLKAGNPSVFFWALCPLLLLTIVFFYPLLLFVLTFGLAFFALRYPEQRKYLLSLGISYLLLYGAKVLFFKTDYDTNAMGGIANLKTIFPNYFTIPSNKNLARWILKDYYLLAVFFPLIVWQYLRQKQTIKLFLFLLFFGGIVLLINGVNYKGEAQQFYLEPQYTLLAVYIGFVLVYDIVPRISKPVIPAVALGLIGILCFTRIYVTGKEYTMRIDWMRETLRSTPDKTVLSQDKMPMDLLKMSWGSAFEFWLLSTAETGKTQSLIIEERPGEFDWTLNNPKVWITKWEAFGYDRLPPQYFVMPDTTSVYKKQ